ncbi:phosphoglycerate mutase [Cypionkella aquatica]|uniref:Phosphoglycerate mutase n=1 Tax=Cypionkella aquatica TaxID=1756042 RepID=A0AA37U0D3_9RHOB|nr:histidine phosphatase family protein [Cypionkella aquatica]GLS85524.1 phosphoglycerate mutase [Cypionkella aquatica]
MIYLCRHGQTEFNAMGRRQGQVDSNLTALGQAQATAMGRRLARLHLPDFRIFASPLGRAHHSARLIAAELGNPAITLDPRLKEIGMGSWDGRTDLEIDTAHPGLRASVPPEAWWFHSPDGETFETFATRLAAALAAIQSDSTPVKIIVAHAVVSRVIRAHWAGLTEAESYTLPVPQDAFYALGDGQSITEIAA